MVFSGRPPVWRALRRTGQVLAIAGAISGILAFGVPCDARPSAPRTVDGTVQLAELPPQARATYRLILSGGPFVNRKDGSVFGNFERALPAQPRGFYREYTVATPFVRDRGARRIVCGGEPPSRPTACYYTADHYATFRQIAP